jgi:hypothetical protein
VRFSSPIAWNSDFEYEVTMFQPTRPPVRWSSEERLRAIMYGGTNEVDRVTPIPRCLVYAPTNGTTVSGECTGHWPA